MKITWEEIVKIEPRLERLADEARAYKQATRRKRKNVCANDRWYGYGEWRGKGLRPMLVQLVGWCSPHPELRTCEAYDVAYQHIYSLLPDCRNCRCITFMEAVGIAPR